MQELAPIGVCTYVRLNLLKQTINALRNNTLAVESELYIFSDGAKHGDENKVKAVRRYAKTINGFKEVHILERHENDRIRNNRGGIQQLLEQYGKIIFLEDDIVTAPGFLKFMNEALDFYKQDQRIFAICGYTPPIRMPRKYSKDVYLSPRFSGWGVGIWKDRFDQIILKISEDDFNSLAKNRNELKRFLVGGVDLYGLLKVEAEGKIDALDVKIFYTEFVLKKYNIAPTRSLVKNVGFDGSGVHCSETDYFNTDLDKSKSILKLERFDNLDAGIVSRLKMFRSRGIPGMLKYYITRMYGYGYARDFIKRILRMSNFRD